MKHITTILLAIVTSFSCFGQIPTANLVAYYPFNGNSVDESVNSNNAAVNGASLTTDRFGNSNSAYDFDGIDDFMQIAHNATIDLDGFTESYSFSYWVNSSTPKLGVLPFRLFEKRSTGLGTEPYPVIIGGVSGANDYSSQYVISDGAPPSTNFTSPGNEWDGTWHHIAFVVNNSNSNLKIYLDAVNIGIVSLNNQSTTANTDDLLIGTNYDNTSMYHGLLDDIRIYDDAITDCEVYALYLEDMSNLFTSQTVAICEGEDYIFPDGNQVNDIVADMTYTSNSPSVVNGCDSASTETNIVVTIVDETITLSGITLTSNVNFGALYQWVDCDNNMSAIIGADSQSFEASANGNYALAITQSGCPDTSTCEIINSVSLDEIISTADISPNPSSDIITMRLSDDLIGNSYSIIDFSGKILFNSIISSSVETISMQQYGAGFYIIAIDETAVRKRIVIN